MISASNKNMQETRETLYSLNLRDQVRYQCEAREENRRIWNTVQRQLEEYQATIAELKATIAELQSSYQQK